MDDIDALVASAVTSAEMATLPVRLAVARGGGRLAAVAGREQAARARGRKAPSWSEAEDAFLQANLGVLSEEEIGDALGRSRQAVRIRWKRELRLPPPMKHPAYYTRHGVARLLRIDGHTVAKLAERGLLDGWQPLPWLNQGYIPTYRVSRARVWRWAVDPANWIYFRPERVRDARLRRILELKRQRWGDEWWSIGRVAAYHGVALRDVNRYIAAGKLPAVKWGNHFVLRSEATRPGLVFYRGRGAGHEMCYSPAAEAFMLLARAVGLVPAATGRLMGVDGKAIDHHLRQMRRLGRIPAVIAASGLPIHYNPRTGALFADFRLVPGRFPALERAAARCLAGRRLGRRDAYVVRDLLAAWARWYAGDDPGRLALANGLTHGHPGRGAALRRRLEELRGWGVDPLDVCARTARLGGS